MGGKVGLKSFSVRIARIIVIVQSHHYGTPIPAPQTDVRQNSTLQKTLKFARRDDSKDPSMFSVLARSGASQAAVPVAMSRAAAVGYEGDGSDFDVNDFLDTAARAINARPVSAPPMTVADSAELDGAPLAAVPCNVDSTGDSADSATDKKQ
jgi:hypothetical protein